MDYSAYCVRCHKKVKVVKPVIKPVVHTRRVSGTCSHCHGKVSVFIK